MHELVFSAFKFKVPRDVFLSLLGWYKFIVTSSFLSSSLTPIEVLKEQCGASASLIIDILKEYSTDIQIVSIVIPILYNLLLKEGSSCQKTFISRYRERCSEFELPRCYPDTLFLRGIVPQLVTAPSNCIDSESSSPQQLRFNEIHYTQTMNF